METYHSAWVDERIAEVSAAWLNCSAGSVASLPAYTPLQQQERERAYDQALESVERELEHSSSEPSRARIDEALGRFAANALGLEGPAIHLLIDEFLPIGAELARAARRFDPRLPLPDVIQAARNAWTACGLQPLVGETVALTPSILAYSLMYPYSDNYIDNASVSGQAKRRFSLRFRNRLAGRSPQPANRRERALWRLVAMVESQYPRHQFPNVFECLLAIHHAQEQSLQQLNPTRPASAQVLHLSCAKGGTSVLTDACLAKGWLTESESRFAFEWGVLLQLGDDLQDLREDIERGSTTLFSLAATAGPLDKAALQLLAFSDRVARRMDHLPHGTATLKNLLKMSWRSLIIRAIADSHQFFSPGFVRQAERCSPFRFDFLRRRSRLLASRQGLYLAMFNRLENESSQKEWPDCFTNLATETSELTVAG